MTIARVSGHDANGSSATTSLTVNYPGATTAGNLLVALVYTNAGAGVTAISGWILPPGGEKAISGGGTMAVFYKVSSGESSAACTSTGASVMQMHLYEFSGIPRGVVVDAAVTKTDTTATSAATAAITTTVAADLLFFGCAQGGGSNGGTATWATATTLQANAQTRLIAGQYIPGAIQTALTATASWTTTRASASVVVAFTPRSSGDFFAFFN